MHVDTKALPACVRRTLADHGYHRPTIELIAAAKAPPSNLLKRATKAPKENPNMSLQDIRRIIAENKAAGRDPYTGLTSADIGRHNRAVMFGDADEAFPSREEWASITD